jgi:DNA (cytosine-5)-methyltransferase 1
VPRRGRFLEDPKNLLVRAFMQAVDTLRPKAVLMENVAEMANAFDGQFRDELFAFFAGLGYGADLHLHNAAEFGVPQRRRRVVFLANRTGQPICFPDPIATAPSGKGTALNVKGTPGLVSIWDAIGDLAPVREASATPNRYACAPFSEFQRKMRSQDAPLTDHEERRLRPQQQARYDSLEPGQGLPDLPPALRPRSGYSGAYGRLTLHMLSPTITRWVFHPGSGRFGHPVEKRILTIREAARLQSFSDDFAFVGTNQQKSWQIGNAVPPLLAEAFGPLLLEAARLREAMPPAEPAGRVQEELFA